MGSTERLPPAPHVTARFYEDHKRWLKEKRGPVSGRAAGQLKIDPHTKVATFHVSIAK